MTVAVIMPVGRGNVELRRCKDTVDSLLSSETAVQWVLIVADGERPPAEFKSGLMGHAAQLTVIPNPAPGNVTDPLSRISAAVLHGLRWLYDHSNADFIVKLDTDALVIGPFAAGLREAFSDETLGLVGSYRFDPNGNPRSFAPLAIPAQGAAYMLHPQQMRAGRRGWRVSRLIRESRQHGYEWGEHVLGCTMAMPRRSLDALAADGSLDDPHAFRGTRLGDDPALGVLIRRAGLQIGGYVHEQGGFGVAWRGLPDAKERLVSRGFSVIHSVKNDPRCSEAEIRAFFRDCRHGRAGARPAEEF